MEVKSQNYFDGGRGPDEGDDFRNLMKFDGVGRDRLEELLSHVDLRHGGRRRQDLEQG